MLINLLKTAVVSDVHRSASLIRKIKVEKRKKLDAVMLKEATQMEPLGAKLTISFRLSFEAFAPSKHLRLSLNKNFARIVHEICILQLKSIKGKY